MNNKLSKKSSYLKKKRSLSARMSKFVEASVEVDGVARVHRLSLARLQAYSTRSDQFQSSFSRVTDHVVRVVR